MQKFFILSLLLLLFNSCSIDNADNSDNFNYEILPIESVDIPDTFELGEVYPITVTYLRPSTCHFFNDFYYQKENNERTIAIINYDYQRNDCEDLSDETVEKIFNFKATSNGSYIFKFLQGQDGDGDGEDKYLTIEVFVNN